MSRLTRLLHREVRLTLRPADTAIALEQPYGAAIPTLADLDGKPVAALIFREREERIHELTEEEAEVRAFGIEVSGVPLLVTMVRLGDQVFESWWNWYNPALRPMMEKLFEQEDLTVAFLSDTPNPVAVKKYPWARVRDSLRPVRTKLETSAPWTMQQFDHARQTVYGAYPTPVQLWQGLAS